MLWSKSSPLWALVSPFVKWGGWTTRYLRSFPTLPLCNHYKVGSTQRLRLLYSVLTMHRQRENKLRFGAVNSCQATHKITLAFPLALANRIALFTESYLCLLSQLWSTVDHYPPGSSCEYLLRIQTETQLRQTDNDPRGNVAGGDQMRLHLRLFQSSRNPIAPAISQPCYLTKSRLSEWHPITAWSLSASCAPTPISVYHDQAPQNHSWVFPTFALNSRAIPYWGVENINA